MTETARSKNGVPIRLPDERWIHLMKSGKYIVVAYKEVSKTDGFVISAFITRKMRQFERRKKVWPRQK